MIIYDKEKIAVTPWVSTHTYFFGKKNSRTYISNEKLHTYVQLDGVSSDLWYIIVQDNEKEFLDFLAKYNLSSDVVAFINDLKSQGLLLVEDLIKSDMAKNQTENINDEKDKDFIIERNEWLRKNHFMVNLFFELTYRCNLKCIHCYNPKNSGNIEIPFDKAKQIIDEAYDLGCLSVTVSGGESTTYSRFKDFIKYVRSKRMSLDIYTNGQILSDNDNLYREIVECYPHQVCLSLYSMGKAMHEKVTDTVGSYNKTKTVIENLRKDGVAVQVKNFLLNINCMDCVGVKDFSLGIGANIVSDISLIPTIEGNKKTFKFIVGEEELFKLFVNKDSPLYIGESPNIFDINEHKDESLCLGGFNGISVSPTLDVNVCVSMPMSLGNLNKETLTDIWKGSFDCADNKLHKWKKITCGDLKDCYKHEYCKFCHYCAGMGFLENGFLKKSDVLCLQARAKQRAYNYLKSKTEKQ